MALTKHQIKERLGYGSQKEIAAALGLSEGHVSQVLNEKRSDRQVALYVAGWLRCALTDLPPALYEVPAATSAA